jgi:hypothetical protein
VLCDRADPHCFTFDETHLAAIGPGVAPESSHGVWIGLLHAGPEGARQLRDALGQRRADGTLGTARVADLLARVLATGGEIRIAYSRGGWVNVNNISDLVDASGL